MASIRLTDGRAFAYQWDTGVEVEFSGEIYSEAHFSSPEGNIPVTLTDNKCTIPDIALTRDGSLRIFAFIETESERYTSQEFHILVKARPKPESYIYPYNESGALDAIAERLLKDENFVESVKGLGGGIETYDGDYQVTPAVTSQVMSTANRRMAYDVGVSAIPVYEVSNPQDGKTVYIGGSLDD